MNKCSHCGVEYPDNVRVCPTDHTSLWTVGPLFSTGAIDYGVGTEPEVVPPVAEATPEVAPTTSLTTPDVLPQVADPNPGTLAHVAAVPEVTNTAVKPLAPRLMRTLEILVVCSIAFGGAIYYSIFHVLGYSSGDASSGNYSWIRWTYSSFEELASLGLLWYLLKSRSKSFSDYGMSWSLKNIGWALPLNFLSHWAASATYGALHLFGFTAETHAESSVRVGTMLFHGSVPLTVFVFQFINPFFEELVARAYVMTEVKQLTNSSLAAIVVSTSIQTSYHLYQGIPNALAVGATFLVFSIFFAATKRIAPVIIAHLVTDVLSTAYYFLRQ
jgi:membrane protease YdiL (CAAX protease family)